MAVEGAQAAPTVTVGGSDFTSLIQYDGTGHGTASQCGINSTAGFTGPVDDSPTDGRVCTGDSIMYNVSYAFRASVAEGSIAYLGQPVTWSYRVTNTGEVALASYTVTDDKLGTVCTLTNLPPGASVTCSKAGVIE